MRSLRYRLFPGFLILMLASAPSTGFAQGIFRCTTGDGQVRFSDKPAPDGNCETVEVAPGPDDSRVEEASEIEQGIKESADALTEDRHKREAKREKLAEERRKREIAGGLGTDDQALIERLAALAPARTTAS